LDVIDRGITYQKKKIPLIPKTAAAMGFWEREREEERVTCV